MSGQTTTYTVTRTVPVPTERAKLAAWRVWGSNLTILALSFIVAPQIKRFGTHVGPDGEVVPADAAGLQQSLLVTTGIFVVVGFLFFLWTVINCKEQVQREVESVSMKESFGTLFKNRPLMLLCLGSLAFLLGLTGLGALGAYIAKYVIGDPMYMVWNNLAQVGGTMIAATLLPVVVRTVGKKMGYVYMSAIAIVGGALLAFSSSPSLIVFSFFVIGLGMGGANSVVWALEADTVEYGEWKTGVRTEGTTYAAFSFTRKMGQALGGAVGAYVLALVGFNAVAAKAGEAQAESVISGIQYWSGGLLAASCLLSGLIMLAYPLTESRYREIVAEVAARRSAKAVAEVA